MGTKITRRNFIKKGAAWGASSTIGTITLSEMLEAAGQAGRILCFLVVLSNIEYL